MTLLNIFKDCEQNNVFVNLDSSYINTENKKITFSDNYIGYIYCNSDIKETIECLENEGSANIYYSFSRINCKIIKNIETFTKLIIYFFNSNGYQVKLNNLNSCKKNEQTLEVVITINDLTDDFKIKYINLVDDEELENTDVDDEELENTDVDDEELENTDVDDVELENTDIDDEELENTDIDDYKEEDSHTEDIENKDDNVDNFEEKSVFEELEDIDNYDEELEDRDDEENEDELEDKDSDDEELEDRDDEENEDELEDIDSEEIEDRDDEIEDRDSDDE